MPVQEQKSTELKHISLLRKVLIGNHSVSIHFDGGQWRGMLKFSNGMLELNEETVQCLTNIFCFPVFKFRWENSPALLSDMLDPKLAFHRALAGFRLDQNYMDNYKIVFSRLPSVHVKAGTLFRLNMEDMKHYKILYQLGLSEQGVSISEYLNVQDPSILLRRIRIVLTCYCLGQFVPVNDAIRQVSASRQGIAGKILARLRR